MAAFSNYLEAGILNHTLRGQTLPTPSTIYLALFTTDPTDEGSGNEVQDSGYLRQDTAQGGLINSGWSTPALSGTGTMVSNAKKIQFPPITDGTVNVTHYGLFDALEGGNLLYHGEFTVGKTLEVNDVLSVDIGGLQVILR